VVPKSKNFTHNILHKPSEQLFIQKTSNPEHLIPRYNFWSKNLSQMVKTPVS